MSKIFSYKDLEVWKLGMQVAKDVYVLARKLPAEEKFGLVSQMQRAAVSIPSNIAEGHARDGTGEYIYHLSIAQGSLAELETQLLLANDLGFCEVSTVQPLFENLTKLGRMLKSLSLKLKDKNAKPITNKPRILNPVS